MFALIHLPLYSLFCKFRPLISRTNLNHGPLSHLVYTQTTTSHRNEYHHGRANQQTPSHSGVHPEAHQVKPSKPNSETCAANFLTLTRSSSKHQRIWSVQATSSRLQRVWRLERRTRMTSRLLDTRNSWKTLFRDGCCMRSRGREWIIWRVLNWSMWRIGILGLWRMALMLRIRGMGLDLSRCRNRLD